MVDDDARTLVLDIGSALCRSGYAGDDEPQSSIPTIIGKPISHNSKTTTDYYIGNTALQQEEVVLTTPIKHGVINNSEDYTKLLNHVFTNELHEDPSEIAMFFSEPYFNPNKHSQTLCEIMFESFNVPALFIEVQEVLSLYASGRTTGLIVQSGDGITVTLPLYEGYICEPFFNRSNFGGNDVSSHLIHQLNDVISLETSIERFEARSIKEKCCYVALNYDEELEMSQTTDSLKKNYSLPDGRTITLNKERFTCGEVMFHPELVGYEYKGIHEMAFDTIKQCSCQCRNDFYSNMVLTGGNTLLTGFPERFKKEMEQLVPHAPRLHVIAAPERLIATWIGGSIVASLSTFQEMWFSKQDFEEYGKFDRQAIKTLIDPNN
ncbi:actin [Entamoeba marina]